MTKIQAPHLPVGIVVTTNGLIVDLGQEEARQFIRSCAHILQMIDGTSVYNDPQIDDIHPGIKQYLDDVKNTK